MTEPEYTFLKKNPNTTNWELQSQNNHETIQIPLWV